PEGGLWLSAVLPPPAPAHIQVARAVADALRGALGVPVEADPPNDLVLYGKKLGGILIESSFQGEREGVVIVGIGINANNPLSGRLRDTAISLREALGKDVDLGKLLEIVLRGLEYLLRRRECRG
ncbi:TPA: biotin--[acetyl-CoA-carboxylase] ligase, partial [Candidatus Micrarchaeota archaeon]|nr:biotin--[acetyl-CoA-carboxylase] ligase [Candidatus Micrarchaeota archaeon]